MQLVKIIQCALDNWYNYPKFEFLKPEVGYCHDSEK